MLTLLRQPTLLATAVCGAGEWLLARLIFPLCRQDEGSATPSRTPQGDPYGARCAALTRPRRRSDWLTKTKPEFWALPLA